MKLEQFLLWAMLASTAMASGSFYNQGSSYNNNQECPPKFDVLTAACAVTAPNSDQEIKAPYVLPAGFSQRLVTRMREIEADPTHQSVIRNNEFGTTATMWDTTSTDGRYVYFTHETPNGAGLSRHDLKKGITQVLLRGDKRGEPYNNAGGDWSKDYGAFCTSLLTPWGSLFLGEEWSGQGRIVEVTNIRTTDPVNNPVIAKEVDSIPNVSQEGIVFSNDGKTFYFGDEDASGSVYKFVMDKRGDLSCGENFVLKVDTFTGKSSASYSADPSPRVGPAKWISMGRYCKGVGSYSASCSGNTSPYNNTAVPRAGRAAADVCGGTPYGRPEHFNLRVRRSRVGNFRGMVEQLFFAATSEQAIYLVTMQPQDPINAVVALAASDDVTPKNKGLAPTDATLRSPDGVVIDSWGNVYIVEDEPNGNSIGGDLWLMRDTDGDGIAESLDQIACNQVNGSESTGMVFDLNDPYTFYVELQHPASVNLTGGAGDAMWAITMPSVCDDNHGNYGDYGNHGDN
jgi:uncharacterized protein